MRKIREVLRLKYELGLENRQIARSCSIPHSTVANYLRRISAAGVLAAAGRSQRRQLGKSLQRIAAHARSFVPGQSTTRPEHRPQKHQDLEWTTARIADKGREIGASTVAVLSRIMRGKAHPGIGYRSCLDIVRLAKRYGNERLEAACLRALKMDVCSYRSIKSILDNSLDRQPLEPVSESFAHDDVHANVRGSDYFSKEEGA